MKFSIPIAGLLLFSLLSSCNNSPAKAVEEEKAETNIQTDFCYSSINNRDTVLLNLNITDSLVTGGLIYKFYEKDSNKGSLAGKMTGDTLLAEYKFFSEGIESIREVIFLKRDSVMVEGYGPMIEKDGKMIFKNVGEISFDKGIVLKNYDCQ